MEETLRTLRLSIDPDTLILPGHGGSTTWKQELSANPFLPRVRERKNKLMVTSLLGFPEFTPEEKILEDSLLATLQRVLELHGFPHLEVRAVEPLSVLEKKGRTS